MGDDFRRNFDSSDISDDNESNENSFDDDQNQTSNSITDNNGITYCLYDSENMIEKNGSSLRTRNSSNVWFFPRIMMNQSSSSILYSGPPWINKNVNHSIKKTPISSPSND